VASRQPWSRDLEEANEILKAASIFFAGELDPRGPVKVGWCGASLDL
jgi:hypothetical protein